jgi:hypothetical protein
MQKRNKLLNSAEIGQISLGKYTLLKRPALVAKVLEVLVRQSEKYCHMHTPDK